MERSTAIISKIEQLVDQVGLAFQEEGEEVTESVKGMAETKRGMDLISERNREVNRWIEIAEADSRHQSVMMKESIQSLEPVIDTVHATLKSVDDTLGLMQRQREQINRLGQISGSLSQTSFELRKSLSVSLEADMPKLNEESRAAIRELLLDLAADPNIRSLEQESHGAILRKALNKGMYEMEAIWSNRADGSFICSFPEAGLMNAKGREWWQKAMAGELYFSAVYISAITKKFCFTVSCPILDCDGSQAGVLGADFRV
ncbi:PDC sensor domain-containing protein [Gorillibacterium timonense]|uniref:PDC sensor domain-containing protein n=1 Tax=Gorillibacterium timonense TaxID=1689269 RepID=UPI0011DD26D2|nr:methyl-accepting chemotaxis protein [Gorillibacterium timonense]